MLPPVIAPGLFSSITGASEAGNYNSLRRVGERIQQARADADQAYVMKQQREREKRIMKMMKNLQKQINSINTAPPPSFSGGGGGGGFSGGYSGGGGGGLVSAPPRIAPRRGTGLNPGSGVRLPVIAPPSKGVSSIFPILK